MPPAIPRATYRLQFNKDFGFDDAAAIVPYLKELGVSHLYASPFLQARPGSMHGYDIVDHAHLNPELGGEDAFMRLSDALKRHDLGLILDFVPNHMGVGHADNAWWLDILEWGQKSPYAAAFDIDWDALPYRGRPGVLLPILGRPYGEALQNGDIQLKYDAENGSFAAWYFDHKLPCNPQRYSEMLQTLVAAADAAQEPAGRALLSLANDYRDPNTPSYREAAVLKRRLAEIEHGTDIIERGLAAYRADSEQGTAAFHRLLERQNYRLAYWRIAFSAVNYRRFFDINDLAGLQIEKLATFRAVHTRVSRLIADGQLQGLRLDHVDGLRDPAQYTRRLRQLTRKLRGPRAPALYVVVEKILADREQMPKFPGVAGTTGYEWLNAISRLLVDGRGLDALDRTWREFTGERATFSEMLENAKRRVIDTMLASEFSVLARGLARIAAGHFGTRDFTLGRLREALLLYVLEFPVYRTYVTAGGPSANDRAIIDAAVAGARRRWLGPDPAIFDFLSDAVTLDLIDKGTHSAPRVRNFSFKLQQFTGPLMAKSLEDTTFYRYHRLLALNEVGGNPSAGELPLEEFHRQQHERARTMPGGLTATASHDTKRGEDARARILALSEITADWNNAVRHWGALNAHLATHTDNRRQPSRAHEYMLYQALIGAWPDQIDGDFVKRMQAYALKAAREGKQETSWTSPNEDYEDALLGFVGSLLDPARSSEFMTSFAGFSARTALLGALNGLSQLALKALLPGVPDFYQGTELWDFSLVDPDNRRQVDFALRQRESRSLPSNWHDLAFNWRDGRIKLALSRRLLAIRQQFPDLMRSGAYEKVAVEGPQSNHIIAFSRTLKRQKIIVAIARHFASLTSGGRKWPDGFDAILKETRFGYDDLLGVLPARRLHKLDAANLFAGVPISVLRRI